MINVLVKPINVTVCLEKGETLHDGLQRYGISIETPCGGLGICSGCRIWVAPPEMVPSTPHEDLTREDDAKGLRLACQAVPTGDITIRLEDNFVYDKAERNQGKILVQKAATGELKIEPAASVAETDDTCRLVYDRSGEDAVLKNWQPDFTPKGLAIDIGTTTLVLSLVCLETGRILSSGSSLNPQVVHGHDVLTRIQYAGTPEKLNEMASLVRDKLNSLLARACEESNTRPEEIIDVTIGANTAMLQLAAKMDSTALGLFPFPFDIRGGCTYPASFFGLNVNKAARVYLPPIMHAYVGTDISAGLILSRDFFDDDQSVLFIDMGTNGEMGLTVKGKRFATSTAAGPAFEGMGLSTGMRATDGAVEKVDMKGGQLVFHTIGDKPVKGVCGSGIVDFIAMLLKADYLDNSGRLKRTDEPGSPVVDVDGQVAFQYGDGVYLTQKDIRQIQLAKGAVRTGIDLILESGGINCEKLYKIYVAGGFGNYLNPVSMEGIGLLPVNAAGKVVFCGNASIDGSTLLLIQKRERLFLEAALDKMTYVQLAESPKFMEHFLKGLNFPETGMTQ